MSKRNPFRGLKCGVCGQLVKQADAGYWRQDVDLRSNQLLQALAWHWECLEERGDG
jgi:hypothetical protein